MSVAVISTCFNEADILDLWIRHNLAEGIDLIMVADKLGRDNSREILSDWHARDERVEWVDDTEDCHKQAYWTNRLAAEAAGRGITWSLPADVDEFPYAVDGRTVSEALSDCPHDKLAMTVFPHRDRDNRFNPHRLPKVCYRWRPDALVAMGSHDVSIDGPGVYGILEMRELQYRSFDHFCRKASDRNLTLEPLARSRNDGSHHLRLEHFSQEQMQQAWNEMQAQPTVLDPIPTHI